MTLGFTQKIYLFQNNKNESKKRKANEVMNGLTEESNRKDNQRSDLNSNDNDETPSKRSRSASNRQMSSNTNTENRSFDPMSMFRGVWNKLKGRPSGVSSDETIATSCQTVNPLSTQTKAFTTESFVPKTDQMVTSDETTTWARPQSRPPVKRKRNLWNKLSDKEKYRQLLNSHLKPQTVLNSSNKPLIFPEVIDLCSEPPVTPMPSLPKSFDFRQLPQIQYKREILDKKSGNNLLNRIKDLGLVSHSTPFIKTNSYSFRKINSLNYSQIQSNSISETSTHLWPSLQTTFAFTSDESSRELNKFGSNFVNDLRESLKESDLKYDEKIFKNEVKVKEFKTKREENKKNLNEAIKRPSIESQSLFVPFKPFEEPFDEYEEEGSTDMPDLTPEMEREIDNALRPTPPNEVLVHGFTVEICRKDMETLNGLNWLNDEIINFYLSLVVERGKNDNFCNVYAFNTFFYKKLKDNGPQSLKRWTRKIDVFSFDYIFIPIHLGMHWCLAVIDFMDKRIQYYDSMGGKNTECVYALEQYLKAESLDKKKTEYPMTDWSLEMVKEIPQQMNGSDCGMFTCKYAEYISRRAKINFTQANMPYFRRRMVYEILKKQLL